MHGHWLKNILGGGAGGSSGGGSAEPLFVHESESGVLDATWLEIHDAIAAGRSVMVFVSDEDDPNYGTYDYLSIVVSGYSTAGAQVEEGYVVMAGLQWVAAAQDGYPSRDVS